MNPFFWLYTDISKSVIGPKVNIVSGIVECLTNIRLRSKSNFNCQDYDICGMSSIWVSQCLVFEAGKNSAPKYVSVCVCGHLKDFRGI